jgi:hypothetical protein
MSPVVDSVEANRVQPDPFDDARQPPLRMLLLSADRLPSRRHVPGVL